MAKQAVQYKAPQASIRWFREARYGMFIHYGLFSMLGRHEWALNYERIPFDEYKQLAKKFNPKSLNVADWVALAKEVGVRYLCLTTRHHEGFALFDTKANDFSSVNSPAGRDIIREYVDACNADGIGVTIYYSVADWGDPGFVAGPKANPKGWKRFVDTAHTQLIELMSNYGKIRYLFYDGCPPPKTWDCAGINAEIRRLQPQILISDRCQLDEDVTSAEQHLIGDPGKLWEACMTSNNSWGYNHGDHDWKTPRQVIHNLITAAHCGGNFLFNVGPKYHGNIPAPAVKLLRGVGEWLKRNGEAVYGTDPHPFNYVDQKLSTGHGNRVYIPLHYYHGPETVVAGIGNKVKAITVIGTDASVDFTQSGDRVVVSGLPRKAPDPLFTVLAVDLTDTPRGIPNPLAGIGKYE